MFCTNVAISRLLRLRGEYTACNKHIRFQTRVNLPNLEVLDTTKVVFPDITEECSWREISEL